jgi:hypothetical protein
VSDRIAAKPGADTPTTINRSLAQRMTRVAFLGLAQNAEHCDAGAAGGVVEIAHAIDRRFIDPAIVMKRSGSDRERSVGLVRELHLLVYPS